METEKLIEQLSQEGAKKPLMGALAQSALWMVGAVLYFSACTLYSGLRPDLSVKLSSLTYLIEMASLAAMFVFGSFAAIYASRPDFGQKQWLQYISFFFLVIWVSVAFISAKGSISWSHLVENMPFEVFIVNHCVWHITFTSVPAGIAMFLLIRLGAPVHFYAASISGSIAVTSCSYLCLRLIEPNDALEHLIAWHVTPVILLCLLGVMLAKLTLKWK